MTENRKELLISSLQGGLAATFGYWLKTAGCYSGYKATPFPCWYWEISFNLLSLLIVLYIFRDKRESKEVFYKAMIDAAGALVLIAILGPYVILLPFAVFGLFTTNIYALAALLLVTLAIVISISVTANKGRKR